MAQFKILQAYRPSLLSNFSLQQGNLRVQLQLAQPNLQQSLEIHVVVLSDLPEHLYWTSLLPHEVLVCVSVCNAMASTLVSSCTWPKICGLHYHLTGLGSLSQSPVSACSRHHLDCLSSFQSLNTCPWSTDNTSSEIFRVQPLLTRTRDDPRPKKNYTHSLSWEFWDVNSDQRLRVHTEWCQTKHSRPGVFFEWWNTTSINIIHILAPVVTTCIQNTIPLTNWDQRKKF